ncbi:hypothetical protein Sp245p_34270 (plasmid) [Azospirillum baldaniorum]|uniref:Uncharacterized protein n=1 Tax=Azospirillum baldaniorum TaxID=1064539 RepID=A0A9P1K0L6_9PROT|nr:hypothetical protein Sp245p_34270 [Azospirillum baldaniorum]CCD03307.1 protein of unknown function [Azospirillum baldaniorum]
MKRHDAFAPLPHPRGRGFSWGRQKRWIVEDMARGMEGRKSETPARGAGVSAVVPGHPQWLSRLNGNVQKCVAEQVGFLK